MIVADEFYRLHNQILGSVRNELFRYTADLTDLVLRNQPSSNGQLLRRLSQYV